MHIQGLNRSLRKWIDFCCWFLLLLVIALKAGDDWQAEAIGTQSPTDPVSPNASEALIRADYQSGDKSPHSKRLQKLTIL